MSDHPGTRITCTDEATNESESTVIRDDYLVVTDGRAFVSSVVAYANGTQVITIKKAETAEAARATPTNVTRHFGKAALG